METNFMEELLAEVEDKENQLSAKLSKEHADLILMEMQKLTNGMEENVRAAEAEIKIIKDFYLGKNFKAQEKIEYLEKKLNQFMLEQEEERTISLPHGTIRLRKGRDKIIVEDLQTFMENKFSHELINIKQDFKPDLTKIKAYLTRSGGKVIPGVVVVPGNANEFSYKLNGGDNGSPKT